MNTEKKEVRTHKDNKIKVLEPIQGDLFRSDIEKEIDGIGMGVLENGIPYLTQGGLARMCGVDDKSIRKIVNDWNKAKITPRGKIISEILKKNAYKEKSLYIPVKTKTSVHYAYPESVCLAFLEYYAFHSRPAKEKARANLILLARKTFRDFIYSSVSYNIKTVKLNEWRYFLDRVDLNYNVVPHGYFSIFKEVAGLTVSLIRGEIIINDKTIPDGSVGLTWGNYWRDNNLNEEYGKRIKYEHNFPDYYPQSASNPQEPWAYPDKALPLFRDWFKLEYIYKKFPNYLLRKVKEYRITSSDMQRILKAVQPKQIEHKKELEIKDLNLPKKLKENKAEIKKDSEFMKRLDELSKKKPVKK